MIKGTFGKPLITDLCTVYDTGQFKFTNIVQSSSVFYRMAANALYGKSENLSKVWQRDPGVQLEHEVWENTVHNMGRPFRVIKSKIIHRYYWTPVRLKRRGLIQSNECWKCKSGWVTEEWLDQAHHVSAFLETNLFYQLDSQKHSLDNTLHASLMQPGLTGKIQAFL